MAGSSRNLNHGARIWILSTSMTLDGEGLVTTFRRFVVARNVCTGQWVMPSLPGGASRGAYVKGQVPWLQVSESILHKKKMAIPSRCILSATRSWEEAPAGLPHICITNVDTPILPRGQISHMTANPSSPQFLGVTLRIEAGHERAEE